MIEMSFTERHEVPFVNGYDSLFKKYPVHVAIHVLLETHVYVKASSATIANTFNYQ